MKIQDLNISTASKSALKNIGLTTVSELAGQNYITLINKFPKNFNIEPLIDELNALGYLLPPSNEYQSMMSPCLSDYKTPLCEMVLCTFRSLHLIPKKIFCISGT